MSREAIISANIFRNLFTVVRDIAGSQASSYEKILNDTRDFAVRGITATYGANTVVSINFDYEAVGDKSRMLLVTASGTTVVVE